MSWSWYWTILNPFWNRTWRLTSQLRRINSDGREPEQCLRLINRYDFSSEATMNNLRLLASHRESAVVAAHWGFNKTVRTPSPADPGLSLGIWLGTLWPDAQLFTSFLRVFMFFIFLLCVCFFLVGFITFKWFYGFVGSYFDLDLTIYHERWCGSGFPGWHWTPGSLEMPWLSRKALESRQNVGLLSMHQGLTRPCNLLVFVMQPVEIDLRNHNRSPSTRQFMIRILIWS